MADVECKQQVNLIGIWAAVRAAYQQRAIDQNPQVWATMLENRRTQERNIARVLAGKA